jgi:hypothetical protein
MARRLVLLQLLLGCLTSPLLGAPKLKEPAAVVYYPTTVGERRCLELVSPAHARVVGFEDVVAVSEKDGVKTITMDQLDPDGQSKGKFTVEASADGVCIVAYGEKRLADPDWLVKTKPEAIWKRHGLDKPSIKKVVGQEEIETPGGRFKAIKVVTEYPTGVPVITEWFAPGRGLVQQVYGERVAQLTSFTRGGK